MNHFIDRLKIIIFFFAAILLVGLCGCAFSNRARAKALMNAGNYEAAKKLPLELSGQEDSGELIRECGYRTAKTMMERGEYAAARELLLGIADFKNSGRLIRECERRAFYLDFLSGKWRSASALSGGRLFPAADYTLELREDFTFSVMAGAECLVEGECRFPDYGGEHEILRMGTELLGEFDKEGRFLLVNRNGTEGIAFRRD